MGKVLVIAEKPSVANDIARALGGMERKKDFHEGDRYIVSSAVGHLLEICPPSNYEVKRGKWSLDNLPVIPPEFDLAPISRNESRLKLLKRLIRKKDVEEIINACDAGREGELIFRLILRHSGSKKPVRRLWLRSMTPTAIREGFARLRSDQEMRPLADAASCRAESDWLVGINGTRAMTAFNSRQGGFYLTTVGRVQTPTLTLVVEREEKIRKFTPRDYWEVHATFDVASGSYAGRWFDEGFKKEKDGEQDLRAERIWDEARARVIHDQCQGKPGVATEESKPAKQLSPMLFDLTSLQREANGRFGLPARRTLQLAQALYERHKMLTYPRTDSRALPEDYIGTVKKTLQTMQEGVYQPFAGTILDQDWVLPDKRIFNNAKVSDHFAIIPTPVAPKKLNNDEQKLYDLVAKRFLAVFYPPAEFRVTTRITRVEGEPFKTEGRVMVKSGWMAVYGKEASKNGDQLPPITPSETVKTGEIEVQDHQTKPPARFSEATLLSAMEGAGKLVDDEELRQAMSEKGLGTPATRAAIIEGLISEKYLVRNKRELAPTAKAFNLLALLKGIGITELCSAELTGDWEYKLKQMERGKLARADFMREISDMTRSIVTKAKGYEHDTVPGDFGELSVPCPKCRGTIEETYREFQCRDKDCDFSLRKIMAGRQFEIEEIEALISDKQVGPLEGFRSRMGRPFSAVVKLGDEFKTEFDFGDNDLSETDGSPIDFSGQHSLGKCPKCGGSVYEHTKNYVCEKAVVEQKKCTFSTGRVILQRNMERDQVAKLLELGKTDLLERFISKRGRPFKAFLVLNDQGDVKFEFESNKSGGKKGAGKG